LEEAVLADVVDGVSDDTEADMLEAELEAIMEDVVKGFPASMSANVLSAAEGITELG
jgi:hypothetical protein